MTPILCFRTIIPLSMENLNKVLHHLYILIYPLKWHHPLKISLMQYLLYHSPKSYIQLGWYDTYLIFYDYYTPFNGKLKKKCYILCKFGYTPYSEAPPNIYQHKSVFTMAEQVGCGTPCLIWNLGVREVVDSGPGRGNSKESFSSNQETGKVFSPEMPFYSKF